MSDTPLPTAPTAPPEPAARRRAVAENDPYPKMILVCIGIFLVLIVVIFSFIFYDFMLRSENSVRPYNPEAARPAEQPGEAPAR